MVQTGLVARTTTENPIEALKDWVARVPRKVVQHRMETAECLEDRVFWAIILWSWCGPQVSDAVVIKDHRGYIQKDGAGKPVPAKFGDLLTLLGLAPVMKGNLSRAIQRLVAKNSVRYESRILYPLKEPASPPPNPQSCSYNNFNIAGIVVSTATFPEDQAVRTELFNVLSRCSTEWRNDLKALKYKHQMKVVQEFSARGILISLEEKKRRGDKEDSPSDGRAEKGSPVVENPPPEPPARPPEPALQKTKDSPLRNILRAYLQGRPIPTALDGPMFERIAVWITDPETLEQFKIAANAVQDPRKWAVYETIARDVHMRGPIPKPPPPQIPVPGRGPIRITEEEERDFQSGKLSMEDLERRYAGKTS
jgi:hypothetical protein